MPATIAARYGSKTGVLIAGGIGGSGKLNTVEIYQLEGTFAAGPRMNEARSSHTCTLLRDGRVLVAGGDSGYTGSAETFDPATNAWTRVGTNGVGRQGHTATLLADAR